MGAGGQLDMLNNNFTVSMVGLVKGMWRSGKMWVRVGE